MQDFVHQQYVDGMGNMIEFHQRFRFLYDVHTLGDMSLPETKIFRENSGHLWLFGRSRICLDYVFFWWFSWGEEKCWNKHILGKFEIFVILLEFTLPETKITLENRPSPKKKLAFQPSIFRGYVSFRECIVYTWCNHFSAKQGVTFVCGFCCRHFFKLFSTKLCSLFVMRSETLCDSKVSASFEKNMVWCRRFFLPMDDVPGPGVDQTTALSCVQEEFHALSSKKHPE